MTSAAPLELLRRRTLVAVVGSAFGAAALPVAMILNLSEGGVTAATLAVGSLAFNVLHWSCLRRGLRAPAEPIPLTVTVSLLALSGLLSVVGSGDGELGWLWFVFIGFAAADLAIGRPPQFARAVAIGSGVVSAISVVTIGLLQEPRIEAFELAIMGGLSLILVSGTVYGEPSSLTSWRSTMELEVERRSSAELAAQRERLRMSEDLHDMLGHTLEVVALKAELATRLNPTDPVRAQAEMSEVQRLARESLADVRSLVRSNKEPDLVTELESVRALLASAGIGCEVVGDATKLDVAGRQLLGRVLREAATNLLRHAEPGHCRITVERSGGYARLVVINDGLADPQSDGSGTGLAGLRRRLAEQGGALSADPDETSGTFRIEASLPDGGTGGTW
ncbi:sensor histidine kinase [Actinoalloteichus hymeniacidonis]|uniref:Signal transduction histidine kinase n=1 Tax=Actinoalloteichus hymeniacidonis TaxID=340345 RepID=A0AAC9HLL7_9PSEU|nr:histidine kinase [Actinoalloteichus hymeniacidonis]AOS61421.1 signal transduction histidine kinase [Actinoalloteichus hymeniacidonis]MBB5910573.1 two-component system sensor histidine kinase DesK [Actinoalloteichus hymeniacidonis]